MNYENLLDTISIGGLVQKVMTDVEEIHNMSLVDFATIIKKHTLTNLQKQILTAIDEKKELQIDQKKCSNCGQVYPATEEFFYKSGGSSDGLQFLCKPCMKEYGRKYYHKRKNN